MNTFLTLDEVAAELRTSPRTVRNWIKRSRLPAYKVGREWRIKAIDLEAFLAASRVKTPGEPEADRP
jgi:putative molybdopterin biosynthesis protein